MLKKIMKETDYYPFIYLQFEKYLIEEFGSKYRFSKSIGSKLLNKMFDELQCDLSISLTDQYVPPLETDLAIGFKDESSNSGVFLLEVKKSKPLSLKDYSQLVGYIQTARVIKIGLLVLVNDSAGISPLSTDFQSLIANGQVSFNWSSIDKSTGHFTNYVTGICVYSPGGRIEWVNTGRLSGISSWNDLKRELIKLDP
jgi:hypothetical protein